MVKLNSKKRYSKNKRVLKYNMRSEVWASAVVKMQRGLRKQKSETDVVCFQTAYADEDAEV
jgi:hypothetical protein